MANVIIGTPKAEFLVGTEGDDAIASLGGLDQIYGLAGDDTIQGGADSTIRDGAGSDRCTFGGKAIADVGDALGNDVFIGEGPDASLSFENAGKQIVVDLEKGTASGAEIGDDALQGITKLIGGAGYDIFTGSARAETFEDDGGDSGDWGYSGSFYGRGGADSFALRGSLASATLVNGGSGADGIRVRRGDFSVNGGTGDDSISGGHAIWGGNAFVFGGDGNDVVEVELAASARLYGGEGDDVLGGSSVGENTIHGGTGNDEIRGLSRDNLLTGGAGADIFVVAGKIQSKEHTDVIVDFEDGIDKFKTITLEDFETYGRDTANGVLLDFGADDVGLPDGTLLVRGLSLAQIDASDFV